MTPSLLTRLAFVLFAGILTITTKVRAQSDRPKLVVGIVVDQMRAEYLDRYNARFGTEGFKRLIREGFHCRNNHYGYIPTYTGPGHASIYTGTTPSTHGIVANDWFDLEAGRTRYCASDPSERLVGNTEAESGRSPRPLLATTITDEWRMATRNRAKVVGVSLKDRSAIFPAGHNPTGAYWFDFSSGNFVTSSYYRTQLPPWVTKFNSRNLVKKLLAKPWKTLYPISTYVNSDPDNSRAERPVSGMDTPTFPHPLGSLVQQNGYGIIGKSPFGNTLVTELAKAAVRGESLGADLEMDFLAVSYSSTDMVGHQYGPRSIEVEDTYLRLDQEIADLLTFLDEQVGAGEYVVFLTADHGGNEALQSLKSDRMPGQFFSNDDLEADLERALDDKLGDEDWVAKVMNEQVYLNVEVIENSEYELEDVEELVMQEVVKMDGVANVLTASDFDQLGMPDVQFEALRRGFYKKRSGHVILQLEPGWMDYPLGGTTHGSGYNYDTHVPLLFFGKGVSQGETVGYTNISQIASTLCFLLHVPLPTGANPHPIVPVLQEP